MNKKSKLPPEENIRRPKSQKYSKNMKSLTAYLPKTKFQKRRREFLCYNL